jgi:hypothetical protein
VSVHGPRIRVFDTGDKMSSLRGRRSPQPKCPINVNPSTIRFGSSTDFLDWIKGPRVDIASPDTNNRGARNVQEQLGTHSPLIICGHTDDTLPSHSQHAECLENARMRFLTNNHGNWRGAKQALGFNIPPCITQNCMAGGGQT